jgi:hypothetical protein
MNHLLSKLMLAGAFLPIAFTVHAAGIGNVPPAGAGGLDLVQYYAADPRVACQDAGGRFWHIPQGRVEVSQARPVGQGLYEMSVSSERGRAVCVADSRGQVRSFNEAGGYDRPGPGPGYGRPGPGYGQGGSGYAMDPRSSCQDAAGRYWGVPQGRVGVGGIRQIGGGNLEVTVSLGGRMGICITDQGGQVLSFNDR